MENFDLLQFRNKFLKDAEKLLRELENDLLELEKNIKNSNLVESVFRAMHTLKGVGAMYGYESVSNYTHHLESIYDAVRNQELDLTPEIFNLSFNAVDHIRNLLNDFEFSDPQNIEKQNAHIENFRRILNYNLNPVEQDTNFQEKMYLNSEISSWYILITANESLIDTNADFLKIFGELSKYGKFEIVKKTFEKDSELKTDEFWEVFLSCSCQNENIPEIFSEIKDFCKIVKIPGKNILDLKENIDNFEIDFDNFDINLFEQKTILQEIKGLLETKSSGKKTHEINIVETPAEIIVENDNSENNAISVSTDKLDTLMHLVSELVTAKYKLTAATKAQDLFAINQAAEKIDDLTNLFRDNALSIRLVAVKEMLLQFKRLIRDLSQSLGKKVDFVISGEDTELDKNIIQIISEPIMHIIRNSMDHGIETPENRLKSGKPETGTVKFSSYQSGNNIIIEISDDGNGIDTEMLLKKAKDGNFITQDLVLSKNEIYNLIFLPGFSTAQSLSEVSGRGVGMDVVRRKIEDIRGEIEVESEIGKGTVFTIRLQQTISIIDTLLINVKGSHYTIPIDEIQICVLVEKNNLEKRTDKRIKFGEKLIPYIDLSEKLELDGRFSGNQKFVIITKHGKEYALLVDKIIGEHQAVIKPVDKILNKTGYLSGTSVLGNGEPAFMLNTERLIKTEK